MAENDDDFLKNPPDVDPNFGPENGENSSPINNVNLDSIDTQSITPDVNIPDNIELTPEILESTNTNTENLTTSTQDLSQPTVQQTDNTALAQQPVVETIQQTEIQTESSQTPIIDQSQTVQQSETQTTVQQNNQVIEELSPVLAEAGEAGIVDNTSIETPQIQTEQNTQNLEKAEDGAIDLSCMDLSCLDATDDIDIAIDEKPKPKVEQNQDTPDQATDVEPEDNFQLEPLAEDDTKQVDLSDIDLEALKKIAEETAKEEDGGSIEDGQNGNNENFGKLDLANEVTTWLNANLPLMLRKIIKEEFEKLKCK